MSSLVWWVAQQLAKQAFVKAAENPGWTSLGFVLLANPATRGFTSDIIKATVWRSLQFSGRLTGDVARAAASRSTTAAAIGKGGRAVGRFIGRHPVGAVTASYLTLGATSIILAQDEDPLTESQQVRSVSPGIGGTGQPGLGTWSW